MEAMNVVKNLEVNVLRNSRILIVEDDLTTEPIWSYIIDQSDRDAQFEWATNASEAERKIDAANQEGHPFDLVITDLFLSGSKTGIDLWKKYGPLLQGRMILVSGIKYPKMLNYLKDIESAPLYLQKPLMINECVEAVTGLLELRRMRL